MWLQFCSSIFFCDSHYLPKVLHDNLQHDQTGPHAICYLLGFSTSTFNAPEHSAKNTTVVYMCTNHPNYFSLAAVLSHTLHHTASLRLAGCLLLQLQRCFSNPTFSPSKEQSADFRSFHTEKPSYTTHLYTRLTTYNRVIQTIWLTSEPPVHHSSDLNHLISHYFSPHSSSWYLVPGSDAEWTPCFVDFAVWIALSFNQQPRSIPSFFLDMMDRNLVPWTHYLPSQHKRHT
jgi:hypothetical protein